MFSTLTQVVDHSGSAEEGAELIYFQVEKVIKQVQPISTISLYRDPTASVGCAWGFMFIPPVQLLNFHFSSHYVGVAGT